MKHSIFWDFVILGVFVYCLYWFLFVYEMPGKTLDKVMQEQQQEVKNGGKKG